MPEQSSSSPGAPHAPPRQPASSIERSNNSPIDYIPPPPYTPLPPIDPAQDGPPLEPDEHHLSGGHSNYGYGTGIDQEEGGLVSEPPPIFAEEYGHLDIDQDGMETHADIAVDGRIDISINQKSAHLSSLLAPAMRSQLAMAERANERVRQGKPAEPPIPGLDVPEFAKNVPPMNILIQIIGSRGDVQPFIALGQVLKGSYNHRVRVSTHPTFKDFVEENGLEFFSLSGDPSELMAFMVKNPGLVPGLDSLKNGDVKKRRKAMWDVLVGGWRACIEPGDGTSYAPDPTSSGGVEGRGFVADAIIANPPSFGHIHCAEKLGVPLHLMFTMPWSPTTAFPHPLANIKSSNAGGAVTNFLSYALVEMMTWQGLGDLVNKFRRKLGLDPISTMWAPGMISRLKVPHTYCWSPALIPKPLDWPKQISISGFFFLSLASSYTPPPDLARFLESGPPPVYIGFGSIVVEDPNALTDMVFAAIRKTGVRALVSKGWGGLGGDELDLPPGVMMLGNCPHDWLFPRCSAVVHHGGAGTTAAGVRCGKPTVVVPFFGDQPFWGSMVAKAGAGPEPKPYKKLTAAILAESISMAVSPRTLERAQELGAKIRDERGAEVGAKAFLTLLGGEPGEGGIYRCMVDNTKIATWRVKATGVPLSSYVASILVKNGKIENGWSGLKLCRHKEWETAVGPLEPISGGAAALLGTIGSIMMSVGDISTGGFKRSRTPSPRRGPPGAEPASGPAGSIPSGNNRASSSNTSIGDSINAGPENDQVLVKPSSLRPSSSKAGGTNLEAVIGYGKGVSKIVGAGLKCKLPAYLPPACRILLKPLLEAPMDFTLSLAQGFHNAPKLYGDDTVRDPGKITGFQSGLKAAGKGLGLGLYDGISGLVTQPIKGAKEEGTAGFFKGVGKGLGGVVLKGGAAVWGLPGYTMKGIHREVQKLQVSDVDKLIIGSRIAISELESQQSSPQIQQRVIMRWDQLGLDKLKKAKEKPLLGSLMRGRTSSFKGKHKDPPEVQPPPQAVAIQVSNFDDEELEQAIKESVKITSQGNSEQDRVVEGAIRASIAELQLQAGRGEGASMHGAAGYSSEESGEEAYQRAIKASIAEVGGEGAGTYDRLLEEALHQSLLEVHSPTNADGDELDLQRAIEESRVLEEKREARRKAEEDIVLEYVKKASLEEQEYERRQRKELSEQ